MEKPKLTDFIYCGPLHKFESIGGIGKRPSIWLNLDFLESLGSKEWENHIFHFGFWLFVKQCHPTLHINNEEIRKEVFLYCSLTFCWLLIQFYQDAHRKIIIKMFLRSCTPASTITEHSWSIIELLFVIISKPFYFSFGFGKLFFFFTFLESDDFDSMVIRSLTRLFKIFYMHFAWRSNISSQLHPHPKTGSKFKSQISS